jgi:GNAT superfamily N-acetyltransferase
MALAADLSGLSARIPSPLRVRAATLDDLDRFVAFQDRFARPHEIVPIELIRMFEAKNPQPKRLALIVEADDGRIVAAGQASDGGLMAAKDGSFRGGVRVEPEHQRRGIGTALLERLEQHARSHGAPRMKSSVRGDEDEGVRFAQRHGYRETNRRYDAFLDVRAFDPSRFDDPDEVARRAGVRLLSVAEVQRERTDADALQRELYELGVELGHDIPRPDPIPMPPYEVVRDVFFTPQMFDRDASVVALRDGRIVALTITAPRGPGISYTNMTGTVRSDRGKGIAMALKLKALDVLKARGDRMFGTTNDEQNAPMRGINRRLGYVPDPPRIELEKALA